MRDKDGSRAKKYKMGKGQDVPEVVDHSNVGRDWKSSRADCKSDEKEAVNQQVWWHSHRNGMYNHFLDCSVNS